MLSSAVEQPDLSTSISSVDSSQHDSAARKNAFDHPGSKSRPGCPAGAHSPFTLFVSHVCASAEPHSRQMSRTKPETLGELGGRGLVPRLGGPKGPRRCWTPGGRWMMPLAPREVREETHVEPAVHVMPGDQSCGHSAVQGAGHGFHGILSPSPSQRINDPRLWPSQALGSNGEGRASRLGSGTYVPG